MGVDIIDILFIIMAAFGFYFGFNFGLMKVALVVISFCFAVLAAMAFTPMTTDIIVDTFNIDSIFLPFISFGLTLIVVLMLARIVTKLIEETVDNKRFDIVSQVIGGLVMALVFTLLYSVLVIFFGQAGVIKLIFNDEVMVTRSEGEIRLEIPGKVTGLGVPDTMYMKIDEDHNVYKFIGNNENKGAARLNLGFNPIPGNEYIGYIGSRVQKWDILPQDTVRVKATGQLFLRVENEKRCFCDSTFLIEAVNDTLYFQCMDDYLAAKSMSSILYKYIEIIPQRGTQLMKGLAPFIKDFLDYMSIALERLANGKQTPKEPINVYSEDENKTAVEPELEDDSTIEEEPIDTFDFSVDTTNMPAVTPSIDTISTKQENVEYEG